MNGLALLIPLALMLGLAALAAFFWAARNGQFEDLDGAALRVLIDEDPAEKRAAKGGLEP
jgi:cbb3-type cytochrome oxidase maturation protein